MSYAIIKVIYGVPLNEDISRKISEWEEQEDERWTDDCGFEQLYSASGSEYVGYCGVELCELESYGNQPLSDLVLTPTAEQKKEALELLNALEPELRALAGKPDVYLVWSDS